MKLKESLKAYIIIFIIFIIASIVLNIISYKAYTRNFNSKIEQLVMYALDAKENVDKTKLVEILNSKKDDMDLNIIREYGIDLEKDSAIFENDILFKKIQIINIGIIVLFTFCLGFVFMIYHYKNKKAIKEITKYIEELNKRNYDLKIEANCEDELSILRNEIYKTTVMLNEVAENSMQDKINLKDSLSDISHQLRTPLTSINIMLDNILESSNMNKDLRINFLKDIKREITNVNFLIEALLKLSKFDANSVVFINKDEYLENIINECIKNVEALRDLKNINLKLEKTGDLKINCDFKWQVEAITNILKNAIEHSYENSNIYINLSSNNVYTKVEILDEGSRNI